MQAGNRRDSVGTSALETMPRWTFSSNPVDRGSNPEDSAESSPTLAPSSLRAFTWPFEIGSRPNSTESPCLATHPRSTLVALRNDFGLIDDSGPLRAARFIAERSDEDIQADVVGAVGELPEALDP